MSYKSILHVYSCYYIHWYKYAHTRLYNINFVESMLDIFKKICFILQSVHVVTPSRPLSHSRPMYFLYLVIPDERPWNSYTLVMQDTIVNMYHESAWWQYLYRKVHQKLLHGFILIVFDGNCGFQTLHHQLVLLILREPVLTSTPESVIIGPDATVTVITLIVCPIALIDMDSLTKIDKMWPADHTETTAAILSISEPVCSIAVWSNVIHSVFVPIHWCRYTHYYIL